MFLRPSSGVAAGEFIQARNFSRETSRGKDLVMGWARTQHVENVNGTVEASFASCRSIFETAMFQVDVDPDGYVLSYERTSELESTLDYPDGDAHIDLLLQNANRVLDGGAGGWHNDTISRDWMNHLLAVSTDSRSVLDPNAPVPDPDELIPHIDIIYRKLFALLLGHLRTKLFEESQSDQTITGFIVVGEIRLFMDKTAFITTMILLGVNIITALVLYTRGIAFVLPRMPTSIGSTLAYFAPSRIVEEPTISRLVQKDRTYSFGRFVGRDGETHVGIEMDPHVIPIEPALFGKSARKRFGISTSRHTKRSFKHGPWL